MIVDSDLLFWATLYTLGGWVAAPRLHLADSGATVCELFAMDASQLPQL